jgi:hypothetical protein
MKPEKHPSLFTWRRRLLYTTPRRSESSLMLLLLHCCTNKSQPRARPHAGPGVTLTRGHHLTGPTWQVLADLYWCLLSVVNLLLAIQAHHGNVALPRYALNCYILPPFTMSQAQSPPHQFALLFMMKHHTLPRISACSAAWHLGGDGDLHIRRSSAPDVPRREQWHAVDRKSDTANV